MTNQTPSTPQESDWETRGAACLAVTNSILEIEETFDRLLADGDDNAVDRNPVAANAAYALMLKTPGEILAEEYFEHRDQWIAWKNELARDQDNFNAFKRGWLKTNPARIFKATVRREEIVRNLTQTSSDTSVESTSFLKTPTPDGTMWLEFLKLEIPHPDSRPRFQIVRAQLRCKAENMNICPALAHPELLRLYYHQNTWTMIPALACLHLDGPFDRPTGFALDLDVYNAPRQLDMTVLD